LQRKAKRIDLKGGPIGRQFELRVGGCPADDLESPIAGETVPRQSIGVGIYPITAAGQSPDYREEQRRSPFPYRGIAVPEQIPPMAVAQNRKLRAEWVDLRSQLAGLERHHGPIVSVTGLVP